MKVFNLTDISTAKLEQSKLVSHTITVGPLLLEPGQSGEVDDAKLALMRRGLQSLVSVGALSVGAQPPASYIAAKDVAAKKAVAVPTPSTAPMSSRASRRGDTLPSKSGE